MVKYSIILPAYNGIPYIKSAIASVIDQDYHDYELIVSNDHSTDGTSDYIKGVIHPNVKVLETEQKMSMSEHWEWALSHAQGKWIMFLGQDDGIQSSFFKVADSLTDIADEKNIKIINSRRAYYFWEGCQKVYGDVVIDYKGIERCRVRLSKLDMLKTLFGLNQYFDLPCMYTNSLCHHSFIKDIKEKQNNQLFTTHPQDANLAAIACLSENRYIRSDYPLGWIGSSVKSAGLAVVRPDEADLRELKNEYVKKTRDSKLEYSSNFGDFDFGLLSFYFYNALISSLSLTNKKWIRFINSKYLKKKVFQSALNELKITYGEHPSYEQKKNKFNEICQHNNITVKVVPHWRINVNKKIYSFLFKLPYRLIRSKNLYFGSHDLLEIYETKLSDSNDSLFLAYQQEKELYNEMKSR